MQKIFITYLIFVASGFLNSAEMSLNMSEKVEISSDKIEIKENKIRFENNVIFQSKSYEVIGEIAEYDKKIDILRIMGSPLSFKINNEDSIFEGYSEMFILKENEIEISGNVLIKSDASNIRGEIVRFNIASGDLKVD